MDAPCLLTSRRIWCLCNFHNYRFELMDKHKAPCPDLHARRCFPRLDWRSCLEKRSGRRIGGGGGWNTISFVKIVKRMAQNFLFARVILVRTIRKKERNCDVIIQRLHDKTTRVHDAANIHIHVCIEYDMHVCVLHVDVVDVTLGLYVYDSWTRRTWPVAIVDRNRPLEGPPLKSHKAQLRHCSLGK